MITISAPGKLMLLGEHAVVYDHPCLVTAVNQRLKLQAETIDKPIFRLNAPDVKVVDYEKKLNDLGKGEIPKGAKFIEIATYNFFKKYPLNGTYATRYCSSVSENFLPRKMRGSKNNFITSLWNKGLSIKTSSEFSSQFGFGSSSASTVCTIKALSQLFNKKLTLKEIFDLAYKTILDIQGKGSGFDVAAATFGGTLYFVTGGKKIKPLKIDKLPLIVGCTGIKTDTITIVNQVAKKMRKYPEIISRIYNDIELIVNKANTALNKNDLETVGELFDYNQGLLASLGVSSEILAKLIYAARNAGAYGAKLSGAGIGDCMIALAPKNKVDAVKIAITKADGQVIDIETNAEGVRVEK